MIADTTMFTLVGLCLLVYVAVSIVQLSMWVWRSTAAKPVECPACYEVALVVRAKVRPDKGRPFNECECEECGHYEIRPQV